MGEWNRLVSAILIVGVVVAALGVGCGTGTGGSSSTSGCIEVSSESTTNPGTSPMYGACGTASCSCAPGRTSAETAACATPCAPFTDSGRNVLGLCLSFDATNYYCSRICTSAADCQAGGTCTFGPLHEVGGIVVDPTMYCVKN